MDSIWIMSYGPVLVDKQFIVDIPRLHPRVSLNENTLSNNVYNSLQYIYDICGIHYYMYTKYNFKEFRTMHTTKVDLNSISNLFSRAS